MQRRRNCYVAPGDGGRFNCFAIRSGRGDQKSYINRKSLLPLWLGSRLCALYVRLLTKNHFQFYHINLNLFLALRTIERKFYQDSIFIHLCSRLSIADWAVNPQWPLFLINHFRRPLAVMPLRQAPGFAQILHKSGGIGPQLDNYLLFLAIGEISLFEETVKFAL